MIPDPSANPGRTEVDLAADVCVRLLEAGIVRRDALGVASLCRALDITSAEVKEAWIRHGRRGWRRPRRLSTTPAVVETPNRMPIQRRPWRAEPESQICHVCDEDQPIDQYGVASGGRRKKTCRSCETARARKRYLSVELQTELGNVLRFIARDDDPCIGEACPECDDPIEPGQHVLVRAHVFNHSRCLPVEHQPGDVSLNGGGSLNGEPRAA